eukprot:709136_1
MEAAMIDVLESAFLEIDTYPFLTRSVSLLHAFNVAHIQTTPNHQHKAKQRLNIDSAYHIDKKEYFVFDHYNTLITEEQGILCALLNELKPHEDESIHFLYGQYARGAHIHRLKAIPPHMRRNMFHQFDETKMDSLLQLVYTLTCPSTLKLPQFSGHLRLAPSNQWMDIDTIVRVCSKQ